MQLSSALNVWLLAWLCTAVLMAGLYFIQRPYRNAGVVDVVWSAVMGLLAVFYALVGPADLLLRALMGVMAAMWSLRLTAYLWHRVIGEPEDGRYARLREKWGEAYEWRMFVFYQFQALGALVLSLPMLIVAWNMTVPALPLIIIAVLFWVASIWGEGVADAQLARFKLDPDNRGKVCQVGLWAWCRHPNYFFEWMHWFAWPCLAWGSGQWWIAAAGPVVMYLLLTRGTGIPHTEKQALASKGEAYAEYQRTTPAFFPWFPNR